MLAVHRVLTDVQERKLDSIVAGLLYSFIRLVVSTGMKLDPIFYPSLRRAPPTPSPIVIVGNPRTGSTFLHRFLSDSTIGAGQELVFLLFPSLVLQRLLHPLLPCLEAWSPTRHHANVAHESTLTSLESDDASILFRYLDGPFLYGFFLAFAEEDLSDAFDPKKRPTAARDFAWLERLWRRGTVLHGGARPIAKLFSLSVCLPEFLARFPEAQVLYLVRDPVEVIPSTMSLVLGPLERVFGFWEKPSPLRERYLRRLYRGQIQLLERFHEDWVSGRIDRSRVHLVHYNRMMQNFELVFAEICEFLKEIPTSELEARMRKVAQAQRAYRSRHTYSATWYGLTREQIAQDCKFFSETFLSSP